MLRKLFNKIDKEELISLIKDLVAIKSINPPGNEKPCAEFIYSKFKEWDIEAEIIDKPFPKRPQVIAYIKGSENGENLILNGHMDVVPEGSLESWKSPPFEATVKDDLIFGRGTVDMKSSLAIMMLTIKIFTNYTEKIKGNLVGTFAIGEETGDPGTKYIVTKHLPSKGIRSGVGVVLEPTGLKVATAEGGLVWYHVNMKGISTHASTPEKGVNAVSMAARAIVEIDKYNKILSKKKHPLVPSPTIKVTMVKGGVKENIIPESCWFAIDRRMIPGEKIGEVEAETRKILESVGKYFPKFEYSMKTVMIYEPAEIKPSEKIAEVFLKYASEIAGIERKPWGAPYSTDMRNFVNDAKWPAIIFGPGDVSKAHRPNECININEVITAMKIILAASAEILSLK